MLLGNRWEGGREGGKAVWLGEVRRYVPVSVSDRDIGWWEPT